MRELQHIKEVFHEDLQSFYDANEVDTIFYQVIEHYLKTDKIQLSLNPRLTISEHEVTVVEEALLRLKQQEPLQYIIGETEFYGLHFAVNEDVLIPRPETEELVDCVIKETSKSDALKILDIGTGSGCIAIALAKNLTNADVYAVDVSPKALKVAKKNAALNGVEVNFVEGDILNWSTIFDGIRFDIIVSNPPYVRHLEKEKMKPNVLNYEPHLALFVENGNALLFYESILSFSRTHLKANGFLYFEINEYLGEQTKLLMTKEDFLNVNLQKDLSGRDRILRGVKQNNL